MQVEYREYQQRSIDKALSLFKDGVNSVLLEAPVGSGKTIMGLKIVQGLMQSSQRNFPAHGLLPVIICLTSLWNPTIILIFR